MALAYYCPVAPLLVQKGDLPPARVHRSRPIHRQALLGSPLLGSLS